MLARRWRIWTIHPLLMVIQNGIVSLESSLTQFLKKLSMHLILPSNCTPVHLSQRNENLYSYQNMCMHVYKSLFFFFFGIAQNWKQPRHPSRSEWLNIQ